MHRRLVSLFCIGSVMVLGLSSCLEEQGPSDTNITTKDTSSKGGDTGTSNSDLCVDVVCDETLSEGCLVNGCNPSNGTCQLLPDDTRCEDDGDPCTFEQCGTDGSCAASATDCDDENPCTEDFCDSEKGCSHANLDDTGQCNAKSSCKQVDGAYHCVCDAGFGDCNDDIVDGCEVDHDSDMSHCGACEADCAGSGYANATPVCTAGACLVGSCNTGFEDCNTTAEDGCEANINLDPAHCGSCANDCNQAAGANAAGVCVTLTEGPVCSVVCNAGFADCNVNLSDGCEVNLSTATNCGSCGNDCSGGDFPNALGVCSEGKCVVGSCDDGYDDCNNDLSDGCETNTTADIYHCGVCDNACGGISYDNASVGCLPLRGGSGCGMVCDEGYADCNELDADGCEAATTTLANCGTCDNACDSVGIEHGTMMCSEPDEDAGYACTLVCDIGFADCNGDNEDGCEVDLTTSGDCGACDNDCDKVVYANGAGVCEDEPGQDPACTLGACNGGFADCNDEPSDGCEVSLTTPTNCGACGKYCSGSASTHSTPSCQVLEDGAVCGITCDENYVDCNTLGEDGCEVMTLNDPLNCGGCNKMCNAINATSASCDAGVCSIDCHTTWADCNGSPNDGCELNTMFDPDNCGGCEVECKYANAVGSCWQQSCKLDECSEGYRNCNDDTSDGCEADIENSIANCGACGNECGGANGTPGCVEGTCTLTCDAGYEDCNGDAADGCEVDTRTNPSHCGGCGNQCDYENAIPACAESQCVLSCYSAYDNCDNDMTNGCETRTWDDPLNCGACANECDYAHGEGTCLVNVCKFVQGSCDQFFADCNSVDADGCEVSLISDGKNCNACGNECDYAKDGVDDKRGQCQVDFNTTTGVLTGSCYNEACPSGFSDCNDIFTDGCETAGACPAP